MSNKRCEFVGRNGFKCGSHAFNLDREGIHQAGHCDAHYWQARCEKAEAATESFVGQSATADFEDDTWTFQMQRPYNVGSGFYRITYIGLTAPEATP